MKAKQPLKRKEDRSKLDRKEWDFREIPQLEIKACFIYEYARELPRRAPTFLDWIERASAPNVVTSRPKGRSDKKKAGLDFRKIMTDYLPAFLRISNGRFPDAPWQKLNTEVRSRLAEEATTGVPHNYTFLRDLVITIDELRTDTISVGELDNVNWRLPENENFGQNHDSFTPKWNTSDSEIKRAFARWLPQAREARGKRGSAETADVPKGRGGFKDALNWLGALRVREHYKKTQLVEYADTNLKIDAPYSHLPDLYENAKKAARMLGELA